MDTTIFDSLLSRSRVGEIVFHIWHDEPSLLAAEAGTSDTPTKDSQIQQGSRDGFKADHPFFETISVDDYRALDVDLTPSERTVWIQESVAQQVKGDLEWVKRSVHRKIQLDVPEPPHFRRNSVRKDMMQSKLAQLEKNAAIPTSSQRTIGSLIDIEDDMSSVFTDENSSSATRPSSSTASRPDAVPESMVCHSDEADIPSPWILTHGNLDWAIHRITRLLTRRIVSKLHMTVIRTEPVGVERFIDSASHLDLLRANQMWGSAERQTLTEAVRFSKHSREVVFYGRIFPESCERTYSWTPSAMPFPLPWYMHLMAPAGARIPMSWLDRLVWDGNMPFSLAEVRMEDRKEGRRLSTGMGRCPDTQEAKAEERRKRIRSLQSRE